MLRTPGTFHSNMNSIKVRWIILNAADFPYIIYRNFNDQDMTPM